MTTEAEVDEIAKGLTDIRTDFNHRASTDIARRFGTISIENLQTARMTARGRGKRGLNRAILNQGWGQFARLVVYKLRERGGTLVRVNPAHTSQQCAACDHTSPDNRKSQAVFRCVACGHEDHADVNAAKNILRRSTPVTDVEGSRWRPAEASTVAQATEADFFSAKATTTEPSP